MPFPRYNAVQEFQIESRTQGSVVSIDLLAVSSVVMVQFYGNNCSFYTYFVCRAVNSFSSRNKKDCLLLGALWFPAGVEV